VPEGDAPISPAGAADFFRFKSGTIIGSTSREQAVCQACERVAFMLKTVAMQVVKNVASITGDCWAAVSF
jgi:hypothetical protein